ncbi:hypothetical protein [Clavibacter phaseoli]|uniref:hypothetical protein n=1 Tax=Clavibacter phaseoli TaxID=1734031 RepID=UPI0011C23C8E|nr:hypothetical protein [Clavibacter phaseoli]
MPDSEHTLRKLLRETVQEPLQQYRREREDARSLQGFRTAAAITLRALDGRIDELKQQLLGGSLSSLQQPLLFELEALRTKLEDDYDIYWRGTDADWRPIKPIAKAILRPQQDSEPGLADSLD